MKLDYVFVPGIKNLREHIKKCEGEHIQQVIYSTYHDGMTQICFGCRKVRSTIKIKDVSGEENE